MGWKLLLGEAVSATMTKELAYIAPCALFYAAVLEKHTAGSCVWSNVFGLVPTDSGKL
jgi:hypothetical protein